MSQQFEHLRIVARNNNGRVIPRRRSGDWVLRCPNCDHHVRARSEGQMDRGYAAHYIAAHRPPQDAA
jgi:uncharacterized C2H2 Zn-finger protein